MKHHQKSEFITWIIALSGSTAFFTLSVLLLWQYTLLTESQSIAWLQELSLRLTWHEGQDPELIAVSRFTLDASADYFMNRQIESEDIAREVLAYCQTAQGRVAPEKLSALQTYAEGVLAKLPADCNEPRFVSKLDQLLAPGLFRWGYRHRPMSSHGNQGKPMP